MQGVAEYVLSVTTAALVCAVVLRIVDGKGSISVIARMLTGIFMAFTVIAPVANVSLEDLTQIQWDFSAQAENAVSQGQADAKEALADGITQRIQAYICNKAQSLGVSLTVDVELSDDAMPVPKRVRLKGSISPYNKRKMQSIIENDLGIKKENQIWT